jgi:hypothetical protein
MTNHVDSYAVPEIAGKNMALPFESSSMEMAGVRVTRAEFSRLMECSKQAVTEWVKSGRIVVGPDGRFDPRVAIASLMRTGDPARVRSRVLEPLVRDIGLRDQEISRLRAALAMSEEDRDFYEGSADEFAGIFNALKLQMAKEYGQLLDVGVAIAIEAIDRWLDVACDKGFAKAGKLLDHAQQALPSVDSGAAFEGGEGGGQE